MANGLLFGTAGVPISSKRRDSISGIETVRSLGLDAMELEFVQGVKMGTDTARKVAVSAENNGVLLTVHAPYFINLASADEKKREASIQRIVESALVGSAAGAWSVVFHAGFFQKRPKNMVARMVRDGIKEVLSILEDESVEIWIRPETTGKPSQFSGLDDLIDISLEFERVMPCIDFAHLHARTGGRCNTKEEFCSVLDRLEDAFGRVGLDNMHIHISGIEYTDKGERRHLPLEESDMNWRAVLDCLKERGAGGVVISESPIIEMDALRMKSYYLGKEM